MAIALPMLGRYVVSKGLRFTSFVCVRTHGRPAVPSCITYLAHSRMFLAPV